MRTGLRTHPKVVRISSALTADRYRVIGALHAVWCLADEHTEDGCLPGYSLSALDDSVGWNGFAQAMKDVQWLMDEPQGLVIPRFEEHNGASAKRRATDAERKRNVRETSASEADKLRTREEKRREELKDIPTIVGSPQAAESKLQLLPSNIPYKEIVSFFNATMGKLPMVRDMTKKRRDLIRLAWQASKRRQNLDFWKRYFEECAEDPFLNGDGPYRPPHETWRPTFDFLIRSDQVTKVYERAMHEAGGTA